MAAEKMQIHNDLGLSVSFLENGLLESINCHPIRMGLKAATVFSKSAANIFIRIKGDTIKYSPLLGPDNKSEMVVHNNQFFVKGSWEGLEYLCSLRLAEKSNSWQWQIETTNKNQKSCELDLVWLQDVGLKPMGESLVNEYYVSQYVERLVLHHSEVGDYVCCRQNNKESVGYPWLMMVCPNGAASATTDGMQIFGKSFRGTAEAEGLMQPFLGGEYAGESSMAALQETPFVLGSGESHTTVFMGFYQPNHPLATSDSDYQWFEKHRNDFGKTEQIPADLVWIQPRQNIFTSSMLLQSEDLNEQEISHLFGPDKRHLEMENEKMLSFFSADNNHVVLREKELRVDRPHGHILQAQTGFRPDENILSTTAWACGVFNSHVVQGNTNFNIFLSIYSSQFNQNPETGQRIFVEIDGTWFLLGVPSAFEMGLNHCRWIYKTKNHLLQVRTWTSKSGPVVRTDFKVLEGGSVNAMLTHHLDAGNGWQLTDNEFANNFTFKPKEDSLIFSKFPQAQYRLSFENQSPEKIWTKNQSYHGEPMFVLGFNSTAYFSMCLVGEVVKALESNKLPAISQSFEYDVEQARNQWKDFNLNLSLHGPHKDISAISEIIPWFGMNALAHFLTPHGLEQFGGAAWGTRDVSQGPLDLLLSLEKYEDAKQVLRIIFSNQNMDGGWPQWWMFDSYQFIRAGDSHGDIFYWVIIGLSNYIKITGDIKILDEVLPYYAATGEKSLEPESVAAHMDRLIQMITDSFIPNTALVPFGGGDWNDSLQPVSHELAKRMISSWTVQMNYQAFQQYQGIYELLGQKEKAAELNTICQQIKADFNKYLIKDEVVAGYGLVEPDGSISVLLHPTDNTTNIHYSLLPMDRGIISGIFTKEQAIHHQKIVEEHLKGPDGARLMDRPLQYRGGIQTLFQRAESSTFFGREIGLMYIHEHIRYAECQAITGRADAFVKALRQANPVDYRSIVKQGDIRQANCYYSSSDVAYKSRYDADERYEEINQGTLTLRGGWRVYSSGPGIYITLIITRFLGLRSELGQVIFDPVIPKSMNGLMASLDFKGFPLTLIYNVNKKEFSPESISVNGQSVAFSREENNYRSGGAKIELNDFLKLLKKDNNIVLIEM